jgi:hypothetical protein
MSWQPDRNAARDAGRAPHPQWQLRSALICSCRAPRARIPRLAAVAATTVCAFTSSAWAQSATAPALKAAFLYNFAKFSEWPADALAPRQRLALCVVGDTAIADALGYTIAGHTIEGHELTVTVRTVNESAAGCHLLYVSASQVKRSAGLLQSAKGASVFTVSDSNGFAESGGVAQLIVENDRMRFAINIAAAQRVRLTISSKLLSLATIVKDSSDVRTP